MSRELTPRAARRLLELAAPLADDAEAAGVDLDRYELGEVLGRGGMGVVYAARDRELGRPVALKVLTQAAGMSSSARQRFLREARAAARLVHPHLAAVYDATPDAIAMQLVRGETLGAAHAADPRRLAALVRDAALAIHYAHGEGVVHRDLKPANLMVAEGERPHVFVMDFGLAKELAVDSSLSLTESVIGTPAYMAPEQAAGRNDEIGPATDVYGLGATMYACLAGRPPFEGDEVWRVLRSVVEDEPPPLREAAPGVDRDLATIVAECMAKEPRRRYPSALALAGDLDRWLRGEPIEARPPSIAYRLRRYVSRRQGAIGAAVVAAGLALLIALPFLIHTRARRAAAEEQRALTERVFSLSQTVDDALRDARATRESGVGHERSTFPILQGAIDETRAFLAEHDAPQAWYFLGVLLREQDRSEEALAAFDAAAALAPDLPRLARERGLALAALYRDHVPVLGEEARPELETWRARGAAELARALGDADEVPTADRVFAEGQLAWLNGDVDGAIGKHREVVEMDVAHRGAHLSLARLHLIAGNEDLAMRHSVIATDLLRGNRPAYVLRGRFRSGGDELVPENELLPLDGMRELLVDFHLLSQLDPTDAHTYGLRGQVQARQALRALERGAPREAREDLELAERDFGWALEVRPDYPPALVDRGVCRSQLARLCAAAGESARASDLLDAALADLDAAVAGDAELAVARYDRALLRQRRAQLSRFALRPDAARSELALARLDAGEALRLAGAEHPWRERFLALRDELE